MIDVQTISIAIASASVVVGVVYYALQLRHQTKIRQTDLLLRLYALADKGFNRDLNTIYGREYLDYNDFVKRYGSRPTTKQDKEFQEGLRKEWGSAL